VHTVKINHEDTALTTTTATEAIPTLAGPFGFFQIAYVTNDLEQAVRALGALYGIGRFQVNRGAQIETGAGIATAHFALAFVGEQQIELIEPAGGVDSVYREPLPVTGFAVRMHHAGRLITNAEEWDRVCSSVAAGGLATPVRGVYCHEGVPLMHYVYADTRAVLGHYLEFMYRTVAGRDIFAQVPRY
jgi:Glyoxalase/Bleomycin resistance protein/Dioxygenase superfamily